ncbi:MAG: DNA polymerase III subunit delta [Solirubrobacteraceae bacterium]
MASAFKPAYLIHGDDHGRIAERRARLRAIAEQEGGAQGVELFEGDASTPAAVAAALNAFTFAIGRRFIIVDGVERWKERDLDALEAALAALAATAPDTTVAFFAREDGRLKAPARLLDAVRGAGGDISTEATVKPWELPKWVIARAREHQLELDPDGARALVAHVGERQQRLLRELEKLALDVGPGARVGPDEVEELTAASAERRAWSFADALLSGEAAAATGAYLSLRSQGERLPGLIFWVSSRVRQAHRVALALQRGESPAQIKRTLRMPSRAADQLIADARRAGPEVLRAAIERIADLELASRGGGSLRAGARTGSLRGAGEDTEALLAILALAF